MLREAVGVVFGLMAIIQAFGFMFGHGAGYYLRRLGAKDVESATRFASTSFVSALAAGGLITVLGLLFLEPLMRLLGSTDTILPYAKTYAIFILIAAPFMASGCVMNNILRYEGRAALAMVGLISGSVINIFRDWFLMTRCHLGVEGARNLHGGVPISSVLESCSICFQAIRRRAGSRCGMLPESQKKCS